MRRAMATKIKQTNQNQSTAGVLSPLVSAQHNPQISKSETITLQISDSFEKFRKSESLFNRSSNSSQILDLYLDVTNKKPPTQRIQAIQKIKSSFNTYCQLQQHQGNLGTERNLVNNDSESNASPDTYTFFKKIPINSVIVITITPHEPGRCRLIIRNIKGQVVMFVDNLKIGKKQQRISKFLDKRDNLFLFVEDYCEHFENKMNYFKNIAKKAINMAYYIKNVTESTKKDYISAYFQGKDSWQEKNLKTTFFLKENQMQILSKLALDMTKNNQIANLQSLIQENKKKEQFFLMNFCGKKTDKARNLGLELMAVNYSLLYQIQAHQVKIKINTMLQNRLAESQNGANKIKALSGHYPMKASKSRPCIYCEGQLKKGPKKTTSWSCEQCFRQNNRQVHMCLTCMASYHSQRGLIHADAAVNQKNLKMQKARRICKRRKRKDQKIHSEVGIRLPSESKNEQLSHEVTFFPKVGIHSQEKTYSELIKDLDETAEEIFAKLDSLMLQSRFEECDFYLNIMLGSGIVNAHKMISTQARSSMIGKTRRVIFD